MIYLEKILCWSSHVSLTQSGFRPEPPRTIRRWINKLLLSNLMTFLSSSLQSGRYGAMGPYVLHRMK